MTAAGRPGAGRQAEAGELPPLVPIAVRRPEPAPAAEQHHLGDRLTAYLDGELGHDARERVQAHLASCAHCLAEAEAARSVKQLVRAAEPPGPSGALMARLLAVAALPDDEDRPAPPPGGQAAEPPAPGLPTLGGSRLTGGSFGRGASFGGHALGDGTPLPGTDPRAHQPGRGGEPRLWSVRRGGARSEPAARPAAVLPISRPGVPRGRRLVVAAAGAFSVAAVTLGGFGSLGLASVAGDSPAVDEPHGTGNAVNPRYPGGAAPVLPVTAPLSVDFPVRPFGAHPYDLVSPAPTGLPVTPVVTGRPLLP
ncbi:zf-HC2 domain-containing protein [Kitasatospora sp. NPDC006697]|uniref:zf-HC2 domain-containing protein n=1 Tax=Kitasatospora sp. NPDC006697 TaxID=3364020 RepID=UPI0036C0A238